MAANTDRSPRRPGWRVRPGTDRPGAGPGTLTLQP